MKSIKGGRIFEAHFRYTNFFFGLAPVGAQSLSVPHAQGHA